MSTIGRIAVGFVWLMAGFVSTGLPTGDALAQAGDDLLLPGLALDEPVIFDSKDLIIFYGGIGYLNKPAQPALADIIETRAGPTDKTPLATAAYRLVDGKSHNLSAYPLVTGEASLKAALSQSLGVSADQISGETIAAQLQDETNLVLSFIGSFEAYVPLVKNTSKGSFAEKHYITSVTAVLSQAGSGRIVLAAPALSELLVRETYTKGKDPRRVTLRRFAKAYEGAIDQAMQRLWALGGTVEGGYPELDIVTRVGIKDPATRRLFGLLPAKKTAGGDLCEGPALCQPGDQMCHAMTGLLAQGVTEQLANAGRATLPPASWAAWGDSARQQLKMNASVLRINAAGGLSQLDDQLALVLAPALADRKVDVTLTGILQKDMDGKTKYVSYRGYKAFLKADWSAAPGSCSPEMREAGGSYAYVKDAKPVSQIRSAGDKGVAPPVEYQQGYGIVAVMNALQAMAKHVQ